MIMTSKLRAASQFALRKLPSFFGYCLLIIAYSFAGVRSAKAQDALGISLSPPTFEISGNPGDVIKNTLRIENLNDTPLTLALDKRNFTAIGEQGAVGLTEENTTFSLASWVATDVKEITIPARASRSVAFTITIPAGAEPGGHFGSIVAKTVPNPTLAASGAVLTQELGSLILLRVAGAVKENADIESFSPARNLYEYGPVTLNLRVKNQGSVHVKPTGTLVISNMLGAQVATIELSGKNVLPDATRMIDIEWPVHLGLGRYSATLVATYGSNQSPLTATTSFVIFPYRLIAGIAFGLVILLIIFFRSRKRFALAFKVLFSGKT